MSELDIAYEWLRYANNDLVVAKHCFEALYPKQKEIASYHCQQCAEKALKAFLIYKDIEPPKTHDLKFPDELCPDENMVKTAIYEAQKVYNFCEKKILDIKDVNHAS